MALDVLNVVLFLTKEYVYLVIISIVSIVTSLTFVFNVNLDFTLRRRYVISVLNSVELAFRALCAKAVFPIII